MKTFPRIFPVLLADDEQRERGYAAGCDNFVSKLFSRRQLDMSVNAFLRIRRQDEVIRRQLNELERLDALKDEVANLVVHDLENPLAGLTGVLYELRDSAARDDFAEIVDEGLDAALALRNTLENMLRVRTVKERSAPPTS